MEKGEIHLVKTAHVSKKSISDVEEAIENINPDIVAIELDEKRYKAMISESNNKNLINALKGGILKNLFTYLLSLLQKRVGQGFDIHPGEEMKKAIEVAKDKKISFTFIDRGIRITISRLWHFMTFKEKIKIFISVILSLFAVGQDQKMKVDDLTDDESVEVLLSELREFSPTMSKVLVDERDAYMANRLLVEAGKGKKVVGVVGAGHVKGITKYLKKKEKMVPLYELEKIPSRDRKTKLIIFLFIIILLSLFLRFFINATI